MVDLLDENLFKKGFKGEIIIGAPKFVSFPYIESLTGCLTHIKPHLKARIHFTIDQESMANTIKKLDFSWHQNLVYNIGITVCAPIVKVTAPLQKLAAINKARG